MKVSQLIIALTLLFSVVAQSEGVLQEEIVDNGVEEESLVRKRIKSEFSAFNNAFALIPHKVNYLLPFTYSQRPNEAPFEGSNTTLMHEEVKFQISYKLPVTQEPIIGDNGYLSLGYTTQSVWQAYDTDESSPFRDTMHEPEVMLDFLTNWQLLGAKVPLVGVGYNHQSNGRTGSFSHSWNRLFADVVFEYESFYFHLKPWWRLPESEKEFAGDAKGDDNPDISHYMGNFELRTFKRIANNELSIMVRNNLKADNKGAIEINYSYPINKKVRGYLQIFHGYGETLLDYNHRNTRIGIGIMLNNWL